MEQSLYHLLDVLRKQDFEFRVVSLHPLGLGGSILADMRIPAVGFPYRGKFGLLTHHLVRGEALCYKPDVIMVTGASVSSCLAAGEVRARVKILSEHYHHGDTPIDRFKWGGFYRLFVPTFQKIVFLTDFIRQEAIRICPAIAPKSIVAPGPIMLPALPMPEDKLAARQRLGLPLDAPIIGNAGWLTWRKRYDVLLQVAALLQHTYEDIQIVIAGGGDLEAELRQLADQLELKGRVHWLGWQKDLTDFYTALDVLIFNSEADAMGRTPVEAMAFGIPVVASVKYGGLEETLRHEDNGFLIKDHDVAALAAYTSRLLSNQEYARTIGMRGRNAIASRHSLERYAETFANLLRPVSACYLNPHSR